MSRTDHMIWDILLMGMCFCLGMLIRGQIEQAELLKLMQKRREGQQGG